VSLLSKKSVRIRVRYFRLKQKSWQPQLLNAVKNLPLDEPARGERWYS
jgi:hypothetical protein